MSPLTKLFVVLLVVLSLILSASIVVFVNQDQDNKKALVTANAALAAKTIEAETATNALQANLASAQQTAQETAAQIEASKQQVNSIRLQMADKDTQLGQAKSTAAIQAADITRLGEALKASEDTKTHLQDQLADIRGANDKLVAQNAELNQSVTDLTNRLEVSERDRKFVAEQNAELKGQVDKQSSVLKDMGVPQQQLASATLTGAGAPAINGVIREVRAINGIPYATISVGSADNVSSGMQFKVLGANGEFLGVLTVDTVELNESTGRLSGPHVNQIQVNAQVKTQL